MGLSEFTPNQLSDFTPNIIFDPMDLFWEIVSHLLVLYHRFMKDWWVFNRYPALYDQKTEKVGILLKFGPGVNSG